MNFTSFLLYCFIVTVTPGPTNIDILSTVNTKGTKKAMEYTYGATIAFGLLLAISALLNTMLVAVIPKLMIGMQVIGSVYMLYLAYQILKMDISDSAGDEKGSFLSGFLLQFLNPKVITFTMTVFPTFILPYYSSLAALSISVILITGIGSISFMIWVLFGTVFKAFLQRHQKVVNMFMALILVYVAVMIWL